jgi:hypothetical protein
VASSFALRGKEIDVVQSQLKAKDTNRETAPTASSLPEESSKKETTKYREQSVLDAPSSP